MILRVFCIYDQKSALYERPFHLLQVGQAARAFEEIVNDPSTLVGRHPADFTLFEVATWDDNLGQFVNCLTPINHGNGLTYLRQAPKVDLFSQEHALAAAAAAGNKGA